MALFLLPRRLSAAKFWTNRLPCSAVSQLPTRTPRRRTPLTRRMPAANSGAEETGIGCFVCHAANRSQAQVDCRRGVVPLFEMNSVRRTTGAVESQPRLRAIPIHEAVYAMIVRMLAAFGCQAIQNSGLG